MAKGKQEGRSSKHVLRKVLYVPVTVSWTELLCNIEEKQEICEVLKELNTASFIDCEEDIRRMLLERLFGVGHEYVDKILQSVAANMARKVYTAIILCN